MNKLFLMATFVCGSLLAQTSGTLTAITSRSLTTSGRIAAISPAVASGGSAAIFTSSDAVYYPSSGYANNCANSQGYIIACGGGPSYETRKDDGKGPTLVQVKSTARKLAPAELPPTEYVALAKSVGVEGPVVEQAKIMDLIDSLGLHVYNWNKVDDYLYRRALHDETNVRWVWKPVRSLDKTAVESANLLTKENVGMVYAKLYARPLPTRILKRMKEIECEMPDAVFLVSDYEVVKPDPFLAITTKDLLDAGKIWIVEQWNEPGFVDGPEMTARR